MLEHSNLCGAPSFTCMVWGLQSCWQHTRGQERHLPWLSVIRIFWALVTALGLVLLFCCGDPWECLLLITENKCMHFSCAVLAGSMLCFYNYGKARHLAVWSCPILVRSCGWHIHGYFLHLDFMQGIIKLKNGARLVYGSHFFVVVR